MKIYLECLIVDSEKLTIADAGKITRHRFLLEEIPVEQYDSAKHWTMKFAWDELDKSGGSDTNIRVSKIKNTVRVSTEPEFTLDELEFLKQRGDLIPITDLPDKTKVTYEGNQPNGSTL